MKLSILDQAPVSKGKTAYQALQESLKLAMLGDELGYSRYWIAEHHDLGGLACPAPEVMLGLIGGQTKRIRIGSGAILLPHYKPYKVAEAFNLLSTLFPGRVDLGVGRAPGGSAEATMALSDNYLEQVKWMPEKLLDLIRFLTDGFPEGHLFSKIKAAPIPEIPPELWILGTSGKSALQAAEHGASYAFGHFMSDQPGPEIARSYKEHFKPGKLMKDPKIIVAVSAICAETSEKADQLARGLYSARKKAEELILPASGRKGFDEKEFRKMTDKMLVGDSQTVKQKLQALHDLYHADEYMLVTNVDTFEDRAASYKHFAEAVGLEA